MTAGDANMRLESAFLKLIEEKPFSKITVNDIVKEAGVHRNTFYYHYQSVPAMLGEICRKLTEKLFYENRDVESPSDCILPLVQYSKKHRAAVLHVYESDARSIMMEYVKKVGRFSVERYIDKVTEKIGVNRSDREIMIRFYTAGMVGVWTEWVEMGMETDSSEEYIRIGRILEGTTLKEFKVVRSL